MMNMRKNNHLMFRDDLSIFDNFFQSSAKTRTICVSPKPKKWVSGATVRSPSRKKVAKPLGFALTVLS